jgi:hypothetical protein
MVRIRFPPAESPSLSRSGGRGSRKPAFRAAVRDWLGDQVGRDAQGVSRCANRRQYLCRAIFQYRSAADGVGENATPVPTKSRRGRRRVFRDRQAQPLVSHLGLQGCRRALRGPRTCPQRRRLAAARWPARRYPEAGEHAGRPGILLAAALALEPAACGRTAAGAYTTISISSIPSLAWSICGCLLGGGEIAVADDVAIRRDLVDPRLP